MPKRIVDGEAIWTSEKLGSVQPEWIRAEYANLLPLATANGTFELDSKTIWSRVYSRNRPSITVKKVQQILEELEHRLLLFRFEVGGKDWGYWIGIDKPGRLPPPARRGTHEKCGPDVPLVALARFVEGAASGGETVISPMDTVCIQWQANGKPTDANLPIPKPKPKDSSATGEEKDFDPERERELAVSLGVEFDQELAGFLDYCRSKGKRYVDRQAAFRNWLRNAKKYGRDRGPKTFGAQRTENNRRTLEQYQRALASGDLAQLGLVGGGDGAGIEPRGLGPAGGGPGGPGE